MYWNMKLQTEITKNMMKSFPEYVFWWLVPVKSMEPLYQKELTF